MVHRVLFFVSLIHFSRLLQDFEKERESPECSGRSPSLMLRSTSPSSPLPPCDRVNLSTSLMNSSLMGTGRVSPPDQQQHAVTAAAAVAAAQAHINGTSEYNIVPQFFFCFHIFFFVVAEAILNFSLLFPLLP